MIMVPSDPSHRMLALLTQHCKGNLTDRVRDLPTPQFIDLLTQITDEFEHFLQAIDLINTDSLEMILEQILEAFTLKIGQILHADRTTIFLVDHEKEQLWSKVARGEGNEPLELRLPLSAGIAGYVATTGKEVNIADAYSHPLFNEAVDRETGYRTRNILCMPIVSSRTHQVVAVVQLLNKCGDHPFDYTDQQRFREFAESIGIILESCNSFYLAARNQRGVTALLKATASLGQSLDLEKTLQVVMESARDLMQADRSTLFLLDRDHNELWSKVAKADGKTMMEIRLPADRGIVGYVASTHTLLNITNAYDDPRFDPTIDLQTGYCTRTILCMPVYNSEGELIGVTQLINKHQGCFTRSDEQFMQAFNIQAGIALENARLFERVLLEQQYQKDILQSLSNAVISTDMQGRIVTINEAALTVLGCPSTKGTGRSILEYWRRQLTGRLVGDVIPLDYLHLRLMDSLQQGTRHYLPEQSLVVGVYELKAVTGMVQFPGAAIDTLPILVRRDQTHPEQFIPWNDRTWNDRSTDEVASALPSVIPAAQVCEFERSVNLTVNPLTNPEGSVRGGLIVLEDISQEKRLKTTMYRYMTPRVAEQVIALGEDALMVGERKEVTILFSDIRSYTSLTEKMGAAEVVLLLNTYFETMVEAVFDFEGTLDKFIGDALMAVFGAPLPLENHAWMAVQSALDMRQRLAEFNRQRRATAQPHIQIGIGISSGEVVSGNIGSQKRMDYTVIGDGVDISSRLEGATKEYGCDIILSEFTHRLCHDKIRTRELDCVRVKGKTQSIRIYELISDQRQSLSETMNQFLDLYQAGRSAYGDQRFRQAMSCFEQAQALRPTDRATALFLDRCQQYLDHPPPESWDGVYVMTTK